MSGVQHQQLRLPRPAADHPSGLLLHDLLAGYRGRARQFRPHVSLGDGDAFRRKIAAYLCDDIVVARSFEIRRNDGHGIGLCRFTSSDTQTFRCPQA